MNTQAINSPLPVKPEPRAPARSLSAGGLWILMMLLATSIALVSSRYFFRFPTASSADEFGRHFARYFPILLPHITGGVVGLLLGPWQFLSALRNRYLTLHRWIGAAYLIAILVGGVAGLAMATVSMGGLVAHVGFGMLAALWLITAAVAYRKILRGEIQAHRQWMIRNYSLTFAAVTLRLWLPFFIGALHTEVIQAYMTVSWLCWVPNLIVAELLVNRIKATT